MDLVKYLIEELGCQYDEYCSLAAAENSNLPALDYLMNHECKWLDNAAPPASVAAAENNDLPMLQWMEKNGYYWKVVDVAYYAARKGNIEMLAWIHQQGCPWDETATEEAARNGQFDALNWLIEHGCPYSK